MSKKYDVLNSTLILALGILISRIVGFFYRIPIKKILGDEGNGLYGEAYQVYMIILTLTAIAIPSGLSKVIAEAEALKDYEQSERIFKVALKYSSLCAMIIGSLIFIGAETISDIAFPNDNIGIAIRIFALTSIISTIAASFRGYFQGLGNVNPTAASQILEQIANVLVSILLSYSLSKISLILGVVGSCIGTTVGAIVALLILILFWKHTKKKQNRPVQVTINTNDERKILRKMGYIILPVIISTSVFSIMTFIDYSMISKVLPSSIAQLQVQGKMHLIPIQNIGYLRIDEIIRNLKGQYSFQYNTVINIPVSIILQLAVATIPAISIDMATKNTDGINSKIQMVIRTGLLFAIPSSIAFCIFGMPLMELMLGKDATGGEILSVGGIGLIAIAIAQLTAGILQGLGKANISSINALIACGSKVILNFILISIPELNIYSVVISTTICYAIYSALNVQYMRKKLKVNIGWSGILIKIFRCAFIMAGVSISAFKLGQYMLLGNRISMLITIPVAIIIYYKTTVRANIMIPEVSIWVSKYTKTKYRR